MLRVDLGRIETIFGFKEWLGYLDCPGIFFLILAFNNRFKFQKDHEGPKVKIVIFFYVELKDMIDSDRRQDF